MPDSTELIAMTATELVGRLQSGELSPLELLDALQARVSSVNGDVNGSVMLHVKKKILKNEFFLKKFNL